MVSTRIKLFSKSCNVIRIGLFSRTNGKLTKKEKDINKETHQQKNQKSVR
jgi:hypothetical protein